jgi:hypothetical protein
MTNEERDLITNFMSRVSGGAPAPAAAGPWGRTSVPATTQPEMPPVDREADALIGDLLNRYPDARYRLTQLAFVQEHALAEAHNRLQQMEAELQQARQAAQQAAAQPQQGGGFLGGLFGGGQRQAPPPQPGPAWNQGAPPQYAPPPQAAPQYAAGSQPGMFQRSGSGFLGSALTTAAGVAGGLVAGNALMSLFSPHPSYGGGFGGFGGMSGASPWGGAMGMPGQGAVDQGAWDTSAAPASDQGAVDQGTWDQPDPSGGDSGSWSDPGGDSGSGDSGGGDSGGGGSSDSLC